MKVNFLQLKGTIAARNLPRIFERYEIFVIVGGVLITLVFAGWIFYSKAYKTVNTVPQISVSLPSINKPLFDKILLEIEQKKQPLSSEPIVDPFK